MKKLLIASGKGGTGKTTVSAAFIHFAEAKVFADCDVDAPNLHLVQTMEGNPMHSDFMGSEKAVIDGGKCIACGNCKAHCKFGAVQNQDGVYTVNEYLCEGCGVCGYVCPAGAVTMNADVAGALTLYEGERVFSTARLKMGRGNSGKLVSAVKAAMMGCGREAELAIIDGSPGIGCPVIASVSGVDLVLIVAEPSLSGISDMDRLLQTAASFRVPCAVCVNKWDSSPENAAAVEQYCIERDIPFVGRIPYDKAAGAAINAGKSIAEVDCPARTALLEVYQNTMKLL
ncbi:MAG: ATP-binding protein [Oscillospiraceae bacterium]|nr:ATP-binding protein [Oscillospiraceae bacterium]